MPASILLLTQLALGQVTLALDPSSPPLVAFAAHHPLRTLNGVSRNVVGAAELFEDGSTQVDVRVRLDSFASGRPAADEAMVERLHGLTYPTVEVKALLPPHEVAGASPDGMSIEDLTAKFQVTLHGVSKEVSGRVWIIHEGDQAASVSGNLTVDLRDFGLSPPSFLLMSVRSKVQVHFDLAWLAKPEPPAPVAAAEL